MADKKFRIKVSIDSVKEAADKVGKVFTDTLPKSAAKAVEKGFDALPKVISRQLSPIAKVTDQVEKAAKAANSRLKSFKGVLQSIGQEKVSKLSNSQVQGVFGNTLGKESKDLKRVLDSVGMKTRNYSAFLKKSEKELVKKTRAEKEAQRAINNTSKAVLKRVEAAEKAEIKEERERTRISRRKTILKNVFSDDDVSGSGKNAKSTNLRGVAQQRGAAGRDFSSLASVANGDSRGLVAAYATLAANIFALTTMFQQLSEAAKFDQLKKGLISLGASSGQTFTVMARGLREVTGLAINTADAMRSVALATSAGFNQEDIEKLGRVAKGASIALGRNLGDSMDRLARGAIKLEPEILDELGIMVRLDDAVEKYANQLGKAKSSLTAYQRRQAFMNEVVEQGERKFGDIADSVDVSPYDKLTATLQDLNKDGFRALNAVLTPITKIFSDNPLLLAIPFTILANTIASKVLPTFDSMISKSSQITEGLKKQAVKQQDQATKAGKSTTGLRTIFKDQSVGSGVNRDVLSGLRKEEKHVASLGNTYRILTGSRKGVQNLKIRDLEIIKRTVAVQSALLNQENKKIQVYDEMTATLTALINKEKQRINNLKEFRERENKINLEGNMAADLEKFETRFEGSGFFGQISALGSFYVDAGKNSAVYYRQERKNLLKQQSQLGILRTTWGTVRRSASLAATAGEGAMKAMWVSARATSMVLTRMIPIIGLATTAWGVLSGIYKYLFTVKELVSAKKDLMDVIDQVSDKWESLDKIQQRATESAADFSQQYVVISNVLQESVSGIEKLERAQLKLNRAQKAARALSRSFEGTDAAQRAELRQRARNAQKALDPNIFKQSDSKELRKLGKELSEGPIALQKALREAVEAKGGFDKSMSKTEEITFAKEALNLALNEFRDMNKIIPELEQSFQSLERNVRSFVTSAKVKTPVDDLLDSMSNLNNVSRELKNSNLDDKLIILSRFTAESSDEVLNLLRLSESERSTINSIKELAVNMEKLNDEAAKNELKSQIKALASALPRLPFLIEDMTDKTKSLRTEMATLKTQISAIQGDNTAIKSLNLVQAEAEILKNNIEIKIREISVESMRLNKLKEMNAELEAQTNTENDILKLRMELAAIQTVAYDKALSSETALAKLRKTEVSTAKANLKLKQDLSSVENKIAFAKIKGETSAALSDTFINQANIMQAENLAIQEQIATATENTKSRNEQIFKLSQQLNKVNQQTMGYNLEVAGNLKKQLNILKNQNTSEGLKIKLLEKEAQLANTLLVPRKELLSVTDKMVNNRKELLDLDNSRIDAARELATAQLMLANAKVSGIGQLTPEQEISARRQELRDRITQLRNSQSGEQLLNKLRSNTIKLDNAVRDKEFEIIRARLQLLKQENNNFDATPIENILNSIQGVDTQIGNLAVERLETETDIASLKLKAAQAALDISIKEGNAGTRFLSQQTFELKKQTDMLREGSGFFAQIPFVGQQYQSLFDNFRSVTGRIPTEEENKKLQDTAKYQSLVTAQLDAQRALAPALEEGFMSFYDNMISGNLTLAESFKQLAISVIADLARMYTKALITQAIMAMIPGGSSVAAASSATSSASHLTESNLPAIPKYAKGGINAGMNAGVVNNPTYLAGEGRHNEAIVPLPNGRSIPVDMAGSNSQTNNINVSVKVDGNGNASSAVTGDNMQQMGSLIAQAVQKELLEQKRPGGILNKNGVS